MTRKLKALGVALFAVLALGATMAAAAQAHEFTSSSSTGKTLLEGKTSALTNSPSLVCRLAVKLQHLPAQLGKAPPTR